MLVEQRFYEAYAFETVTIASASATASLTQTVYEPTTGVTGGQLPPKAARVYVGSTNPIRYRIDGGAASSTSGHHIAVNTTVDLYGRTQIKNFSSTSFTSGTAAEITVTYFR